VALRRTYRCT